ncbi:TPA: CfaE/CblD family pilus tip adhesin [Escherichia coli]
MMKRVLLSVLLSVMSFQSLAWENKEPTDQTRTVTITADRSSLPGGNYSIFNNELVAFDNDNPSKYGRSGFVCKSSSDSKNGMCRTSQSWGGTIQETSIPLRFTESRSGISKDLIVKGRGYVPYQNGNSCGIKGPVLFGTVYFGLCQGGYYSAGYLLTLYIEYSELSKLPVGGVWTAQLLLEYRQWVNIPKAIYTVDFTINLTDKNNIQVWLPQFGKVTPQVDLNITPFHGGGLKGKNVVDICFYDGYSTNSSNLQLQFTDDEGSGAGTDTFRLTSTDGNNHKLPYKVSLAFQGQGGEQIINGQTRSLNGSDLPVNWARVLPVTLPDIPVPVLCWPATLTLSADLPESQPAGNYRGQLTVVFTPDSASL